MAKLAPIFNDAQLINGIPANGAKLFTYVAGSSTKQATYTDAAGLTAQSNPILLNSRGEPAQPIWLTEGLSYKFVFAPATDTDPPVSPIRTIDNITGINDASLTIDQWVDSGLTPTYVSATSFTVPGDQTSIFTNKRRIKSLVTAGTAYSTVLSSTFGALTTVTVVNDSTPLDSGLSNVQIGLITPNNSSLPSVIESTRATVAATATTTPLWTSTAQVQDWTGTPTITDLPDAPVAGAWREVYPAAGTIFTDNANLDVQGDTNYIVAAGDKIYIEALTTSTFKIWPSAKNGLPTVLPVIRNYITGLTLSTSGSSSTISVSSGQASDTTNSITINLASSISKTTSSWAVGSGNGGLDTGAIANNTWYHLFLIRRPDTGVVDVLISLSATSPTLPTNYTQFRRIGSAKTNGSAQWILFFQKGDDFYWDVSVRDISVTNPGTAAVIRTLASVPTGVIVKPIATQSENNQGSNHYSLTTSLDQTDTTPSATVYSFYTLDTGLGACNFPIQVYTNTSAQIRTRQSASAVGDALDIIVHGWTDTRGA